MKRVPYLRSIFALVIVVVILFVLPVTFQNKFDWVRIHIATFAAVGGLLMSLVIKLIWDEYSRPVLEIIKIQQVKSGPMNDRYTVNRIIVKNTGKTAAVNCKGYIIIDGHRERVCWSIPVDRTLITINTRDDEYLDACAFKNEEDGPTLIIPTENTNGWDKDSRREFTICDSGDIGLGQVEVCRNLGVIGLRRDCNLSVLVTSENAEPVERNARIAGDKGNYHIELLP